MVKKPKQTIAGCENCLYGKGEPSMDEADNETLRMYCAARFVNVDVDMMNKYCDFFVVKPPEKD